MTVLMIAMSFSGGGMSSLQSAPVLQDRVLPGMQVVADGPIEPIKASNTVKRRALRNLVWLKVPNMLVMTLPGPANLWLPLPKYSSLEAFGGPSLTKADTPYRQIRISKHLVLVVSLHKQEKGEYSDMRKPSVARTNIVVSKPWIGWKSMTKEQTSYLVGIPGKTLWVFAKYDNRREKKKAAALCETIIQYLRTAP
jgi:hypothetical protein